MYTVNVYCEYGVLRKVSNTTLSVLFIPCDGSILHLSTYISPTYIENTLWAAGIVSVTTLPAVNDMFTPRVNTNVPQLCLLYDLYASPRSQDTVTEHQYTYNVHW